MISSFRTGDFQNTGQALSAHWYIHAFNLYTDGTPTTDEYDDTEEQIVETRLYSVSDIFCTGDARYFWEAIKIRYPDYCFYVDWEDLFYAED